MSHLILLSPAKSLRFDDAPLGREESLPWSQPRLAERSGILCQALAALSAEELMALMELSRPLAELNHSRFARLIQPASGLEREPGARRALFAFHGDAYEGLEPESLAPEALQTLERRLRVLSGLYGALRPSDAILPHRLEMGRKPQGIGAKSLVAFWGDSIARALIEDARAQGASGILNLASEEYAKAALPRLSRLAPELGVVSARFESLKHGQWKVISFEAKRARGLFTRFIAQHPKLELPELCAAFDVEGWRPEGQPDFKRPGALDLVFRKLA